MSYSDKYEDFFNEYDKSGSPSTQPRELKPRETSNRHRKKRKKVIRAILRLLFLVIPIVLIATIIILIFSECSGNEELLNNSGYNQLKNNSSSITNDLPTVNQYGRFTATDYTVSLGGEIESNNAILVDISNNTILARKSSEQKISPASMTKVMTLLVAAENIDSIDNTFTMTNKVIDPLYREGLTLSGFKNNEQVLIKDMFYAMVLESAADAAVGLAVHISGSEEAFVNKMNEKAKSLGLTSTHFTNTSGLHEDGHYTTCHEMAIIMNAAISNDFCRTLLTTKTYNVPANEFHDELEFVSGMFSRMTGKEPNVATVLGGKTGYTVASRNCLVSFAETDDKRIVICVTADAGGKEKPINDCIKMYKKYSYQGINKESE